MIIVKLNGGLGNQLFQYAFGLRLAEQNQTELVLDLTFLQDKTRTDITLRDYELGIFPNIKDRFATAAEIQRVQRYRTSRPYQAWNRLRKTLGLSPAFSLLQQPQYRLFDYDAAYARQAKGQLVYVDGLWQNEQFFQGNEAAVRHAFRFPPLLPRNEAMAGQIATTTSVSLHLRRGDYVSEQMASQWLSVCSPEYYEQAIALIAGRVENPTFYVFSDELPYARQLLANLSYPVVYVDQNDAQTAHEDMHIMSRCQHHIIANSTFSFWGAWLNPSPQKLVVAPAMYFPKINEGITGEMMTPANWIKL